MDDRIESLPYGTSVIPEYSHWTGYFLLHVVRRAEGKLYVPKDIHWVEQDAGIVNPDAAIRFHSKAAIQKLFDDLYAMGMRPSDGKNNDAVILAKDAHLEDLRRLVFKTKPNF